LTPAAACPAGAQEPLPRPLAVGSIRDQIGRPVPARITVFDVSGTVVGQGAGDPDGTFAVSLSAPGASLAVSCRHCAPLRVTLPDAGPVALIVTRYLALDQSAPNRSDLAALPYRDPAQAAALVPYAVAVGAGTRVVALSDRGLGQGLGLVLDAGAATYDPVTGDQGLFAFPGRSVEAFQTSSPARAFTYGSYAGGGTFAFDRLGDEPRSEAAFDSGAGWAFSVAAPAGSLTPALAASRDDDGVLRERADLALQQDFAGGTLRAQAALASQDSDSLATADRRSLSLLTLAYSTVSRQYVTSLGAGAEATHGSYELAAGADAYGTSSSALDAYLRVERPAFVTLAVGGAVRAWSGAYSAFVSQDSAHYDSELAYVEAAHAGPLWFDAGVGVDRVGVAGTGSDAVGLPSLAAGATLPDGLGLRLAASTSLRAPELFELPQPAVPSPLEVQRTSLLEAALEFDDSRRVRFGADLFRQRTTGLEADSLGGVGFSLTWQIAPRLSLRAWTLHDATATNEIAPAYGSYASLGSAFGRAAVWATYEAPLGLRFDAIARRESGASGTAVDFDADVIAPLVAGVALAAGTSRTNNLRRTYVGLRWPRT
jgi:hypothetical protein